MRMTARRVRPSTAILGGPTGALPAGTTTATFRFGSSSQAAVFECRVDTAAFRRCTSPAMVTGLRAGDHVFAVRARIPGGRADATAATRRFSIEAPPAPAGGTTTGAGGRRPAAPASPAPGSTDRPAPVTGGQLLRDDFEGPDGLITNKYAFWNASDKTAFRSSIWEAETGSFFRRGGTGWTGVPDDVSPNRDSSNGTGSEIFRMWTRRADFGDVAVEMNLLHEGFTEGSPGWGAKSWDGTKIWLRRQGHTGADVRFYTAEVSRRQGNVIVQKKCAEDDYALLAQTSSNSIPARTGEWERVGGVARNNPDGSVTIQVLRGGRVVLEAVDRGELCEPLRAAGRVGIRADNSQFRVDDFTVSAL
jgi:hypothetical protein